MKNIVGLVPAAGKGTRLGLPFSKEMFPDIHSMSYRPVIMNTVEAMQDAGVEHVIFTINPQKSDIMAYLGNGRQFNMHFSYCVHPIPRSLPESLNEAHHLTRDKTVLFAMPDTVITPRDHLKYLVDAHIGKGTQDAVTLGCFRTNNPRKFGMVELSANRVLNIVDKPATTNFEWMWGTMVWEPEFTLELQRFVTGSSNRPDSELILSDALAALVHSERVGACMFQEGSYRDIGTFDEIINWSQTKPTVTTFN